MECKSFHSRLVFLLLLLLLLLVVVISLPTSSLSWTAAGNRVLITSAILPLEPSRSTARARLVIMADSNSASTRQDNDGLPSDHASSAEDTDADSSSDPDDAESGAPKEGRRRRLRRRRQRGRFLYKKVSYDNMHWGGGRNLILTLALRR